MCYPRYLCSIRPRVFFSPSVLVLFFSITISFSFHTILRKMYIQIQKKKKKKKKCARCASCMMDKQRVSSVIVGYTKERKEKRYLPWCDYFFFVLFRWDHSNRVKEVINNKVYIYTYINKMRCFCLRKISVRK